MRVRIEERPADESSGVSYAALLMTQGHDGLPEGDDQPWGSLEFNTLAELEAWVASALGDAISPNVMAHAAKQLIEASGGADKVAPDSVAVIAAVDAATELNLGATVRK